MASRLAQAAAQNIGAKERLFDGKARNFYLEVGYWRIAHARIAGMALLLYVQAGSSKGLMRLLSSSPVHGLSVWIGQNLYLCQRLRALQSMKRPGATDTSTFTQPCTIEARTAFAMPLLTS